MNKTYVILFIGIAAISFAAVLIRLAEAPSMVIATYRMGIAALVLMPLFVQNTRKKPVKLAARDWALVLLAGFFLAVHFGLWITSLEFTSIASSVVLVTSHPAFVAIASYIVFKERLNSKTIAGIIAAIFGVLVVNFNQFEVGSTGLSGNIMAFVAGLAMGSYLITGRRLKDKLGIINYLALIYSVSAVFLLFATVALGYNLFGYPLEVYAIMILIALVPQLIGHSCINITVRLLPATFVAIAILVEPVGATLLGWIILNEPPAMIEIVGGLIIITGILIVFKQKNSKS